MRSLISPVILCTLFVATCESPLQGDFGWSGTDDREIPPLELSLLRETEFLLKRDNLYFYDHETIRWVYQIRSGKYTSEGFLAALYENDYPTQPVEIDLRYVPIEIQGSNGYIRQSYPPLHPGKYLLQIGYLEMVVDEVEFNVVPSGGPRAVGEDPDSLLDDAYGESGEEPVDEIEKYSS